MPASFDKNMTIDEHKGHACLVSVGGPLGLDTGETVLRLDFWIFQDDAACIGFLPGRFQGAAWKLTPNPDEDHFGAGFHPGAAIGMGLMVKEIDNGDGTKQVVAEQWNRPINLLAPTPISA